MAPLELLDMSPRMVSNGLVFDLRFKACPQIIWETIWQIFEDWLELIFEPTWDPWIDGASLTFENPHRMRVTIN